MAEEDKLNFLNETPDTEPEVAEEAEAEEEPQAEEPEAEPEEAPQEAAEEEGTGEKEGEPPSPEEEAQRAIPVTALLDEREKRQKAERELEELRKWRQEREREAAQGQAKPDFYENPEQAVSQYVTQVKLEQSRFLAEREFGKEAVEEAFAYFDQHPDESRELLKHPSPFHAAVEHYKQRKFLSEVKDPDEWREQERERIRQEILAESQKSQQPKPKTPPPSMSNAPSTGRDAITPGSAFDQMLPD